MHGDQQSRLEEQAAQHEDADQRPLGTLHSQLLGRTGPTHQHRHGGGDDQVEEEELEIAQVGVDLGRRNHQLSVGGLGKGQVKTQQGQGDPKASLSIADIGATMGLTV